MRKKNVFILLAIFILLLSAAFLFNYVKQQKGRSDKPYAGLDKESISRMDIKTSQEHFIFVKSSATWQITSPEQNEADQEVVNKVLDKIINIEVGDVISTNPDKHADFRVDRDTGGTIISIYQKNSGKAGASFILGKTAFDYLHSYFRYPGSQETLVCKGLSSYDVRRDLKHWRKKPDPEPEPKDTLTKKTTNFSIQESIH